MLKDLLEYLAKSLVDSPDEVHVEATETDTTVVLELSVAKDDVGKVIGKQGRIAGGSGTSIQDVNQLLKQYREMQKMLKMFSSGRMKGFRLPGMSG